MFDAKTTAVAIPAKNEESCIGSCLEALAAQTVPPGHIVLLLNNCSDRTAEVARAVRLPAATRLHVMERDLAAPMAHVGCARRMAMDFAAMLTGRGGVLLTTDADGRADSDWVEWNLRLLNQGADVVAGWVQIDPEDEARLPRNLIENDARECAYDALCDEIEALMDPDPADPWPRHTQNSGASVGVTVEICERAGGIPPVRGGEDRAFFAALRRADAKIRHAPECHVFVSGRTEGRAAGGMAETIRRRLTAPDLYIDPRLEPVDDLVRRISLRREARAVYRGGGDIEALASRLGVESGKLRGWLAVPAFGMGWAAIEVSCASMRRHKVACADVLTQTARATAVRDELLAKMAAD